MEKPDIPQGQIVKVLGGLYKGHGAKFIRWKGKDGAEVIINGKIRVIQARNVRAGL